MNDYVEDLNSELVNDEEYVKNRIAVKKVKIAFLEKRLKRIDELMKGLREEAWRKTAELCETRKELEFYQRILLEEGLLEK